MHTYGIDLRQREEASAQVTQLIFFMSWKLPKNKFAYGKLKNIFFFAKLKVWSTRASWIWGVHARIVDVRKTDENLENLWEKQSKEYWEGFVVPR